MAFVRVEQRNARLASPVRLEWINGREGKVAKATLTAISNVRRGSGDEREDEATALQWTVWGKQAENAAEYLGKGSHVNVVGRVRNNNYEKGGETVYALAFMVEEIDYLESKADAQARLAKRGSGSGLGDGAGGGGVGLDKSPEASHEGSPSRARVREGGGRTARA